MRSFTDMVSRADYHREGVRIKAQLYHMGTTVRIIVNKCTMKCLPLELRSSTVIAIRIHHSVQYDRGGGDRPVEEA